MKTGIVAFAFGIPSTISSNRAIAEIASRAAKKLDSPVFTQFLVQLEPGIPVEYVKEDPENPAPTLSIARDAIQYALRSGIQELYVAAARPHLWRCLRDLEYAIREVNAQINILTCPEIYQYPNNVWFCPESRQTCCCTEKQWRWRNWIVESIPMFLYVFIYTKLRRIIRA